MIDVILADLKGKNICSENLVYAKASGLENNTTGIYGPSRSVVRRGSIPQKNYG